jgi:arylsulfatase A-like enzyme
LLVVDDLRPALGSYGNAVVRSPQIDGLAAAGVRFDRAYAQFPLCSPSRVSMLLGRYPAATGVLGNGVFFRDLDPGAVTLPQYFRRHGYVAMRAGKIFHEGLEDEASWDVPAGLPAGGAEVLSQEELEKRRVRRALAWGYDLGRPWKAVKGQGEKLLDARIAAQAIALMEQYRDRPFFLGVGVVRPHTPYLCPKRFFDLYQPKTLTLPPDFAPRPTPGPGVPEAALTKRNGDLLSGDTPVSQRLARTATAAYYACVSATDHEVDGQRLAPLLRDPEAAWENPAFSATSGPGGRSIRTERWRYTEWDGAGGGAELYDEAEDPHELHNRAADPEHRQIVAELRRRLAEAHP